MGVFFSFFFRFNYADGYKFHLSVVNDVGRREVLRITNEADFCGGVLPCMADMKCCGYQIKVSTADSSKPRDMGCIKLRSSKWSFNERWDVLSESEEKMLRIEQESNLCFSGPCCPYSVKAEVYSADGTTPIGTVEKISECKRLDHCCLTFPKDLDINMKAALLGYAFYLINAVSPAGLTEDEDDYEEDDEKKKEAAIKKMADEEEANLKG